MPAVRLDFRLPAKLKKNIQQAAELSGKSLTEFATSILERESEKILQQQSLLVLSDQDRDVLLAALESPPKPNAALKKAAREYRKNNA